MAVPSWIIQSRLFTRHVHFLWHLPGGSYVTAANGLEKGKPIETMLWSSNLPPGAEIKRQKDDNEGSLELELSDVPALPREENAPPAINVAYHVNFYFTPYASSDAFWKDMGSRWSNEQNAFIGPGPGVKAAVIKFTSPADTPEQKVKKLYYAVMDLDNTSVDAMRGAPRRTNPNEVFAKSSDVILARGWGNADQITNLFIALVRAAGLSAYAMRVPDRSQYVFNREDMNLGQLNDNIAIVNFDDKDIFLDPGTRFCPFEGLSSRHIAVSGLRQTASGTEIATTPVRPPSANQRLRNANLALNEKGEITGTMKLTMVGTAGIISRQIAAVRGEAALEGFLKDDLLKTLPTGMQIDITSIDKLKDLDEPLVLQANLKGTAATPEGGKLLLKLNVFESRSEPLFKPETRQLPIYFTVSNAEIDAVHINLPAGFTVSSLPANVSEKLASGTTYDLNVASGTNSITLRRTYILGPLIYLASDYPEIRSFYSKIGDADKKTAELIASQ